MARLYDNGTLSAARRDEFLAMVKSRIETKLATEEPTLEGLMAKFMDTVSKHRLQTELMRIDSRGFVPAEDGTPIRDWFKGWGPSIVAGLRRAVWHLHFDREGGQDKAAANLGEYVDAAIRRSGGDTTVIDGMIEAHRKLDEIDAAIDKLREDVSYIPFAVGASNLTMGVGAGKLANADNASRAISSAQRAHEKAAELVRENADLSSVFPSLHIDKVGMFRMLASPFNPDAGDAVKEAKAMLPLIDEFKNSLDEWDVMAAFETIWQNRAAACQALGMDSEAKICAEVAKEYDSAYFEALHRSWDHKPTVKPDAGMSPAP